VIPECAHPQYKSMMLELMKLNVDKPDLIYNLWTPMIVTKTVYPIPMILETMFETSKILPDWVDKCNCVDKVWNPSLWGTKIFKECGVENAVHMPFGMYFSDITDSIKKLDDDPRFKFLFINQYSVRKNAKTVIQAFLETFQATDNVVLYIRADVLTGLESVGFDSNTIIRDATELKIENPDSPQIIILDNIVDETLHKLYNSVDVVW
jgi:glycosyltransferase involved in cell wall biosynthesis